MPIYEFVCNSCGKRYKRLVGVVSKPEPLCCPDCKSADNRRLISRFARVRSEDDALDSIADEVESMGDESDPRALRRLMRDMSSAIGEDMDDDIEQMIDEEASQPDSVSDSDDSQT